MLDLSGVAGGALGQSNAEQERPYLAMSGKDQAYKAGRLKAQGGSGW